MRRVQAALVCLLLAATANAEPPPTAMELVAPALLSSPLHTVRPELTLIGPMANFEIDTRFGELEAPSVELLAIRVEELNALEKIAAVSRTEMYRTAATAAGSRTARAVGTVVSNPVETARGLPEGIRRLFSRRADSVKRRARDLSDKATDAARDRPDYAGQSATDAEDKPPERSTGERAERAASSFALDYVGYNKARRESARLLEIDPYTSNPILNAKLDDLAWATLAGGFTFGKALGLVTGGAGPILSRVVRANDIVWEKSPEDVRAFNEERLRKLRLSGPEARKFLRNGSFSPTLQTAFVDALAGIGPAIGRTDVLDFAGSAQNELEARFVLRALQMLLAETGRGFKTYSIAPTANALLITGWDGSTLLPLPVDYLTGSDEIKSWFRDQLQAPAGTRVLIAGWVAADAKALLESMHLRVESSVSYPDRPPYASQSPSAP